MPFLEEVVEVAPEVIYYSQTTCGSKFKDGDLLIDTIEGLRVGAVDPYRISSFTLDAVYVQDTNRWISLDNRRLYCLKYAKIDPVRLRTTAIFATEKDLSNIANERSNVRVYAVFATFKALRLCVKRSLLEGSLTITLVPLSERRELDLL